MKFANWLRKKREYSGYSQADVATHLNITRECLSKWENAKARPNLETVSQIFLFYKCSNEEILELFKEINDGIENGHTL